MKKNLTISGILFIAGYEVITFCIDDKMPFQPVYWLIAKLACIVITIICFIITEIKNPNSSRLRVVYIICLWCVISVYYGYKDISKFKRNARQDKFAWGFNKQRQLIGVPQIPANWLIRSRSNSSFELWKGEKDTIGHVSKYIFIDSTYKIEFETDEYNFKSVQGVSKSMSVRTIYSRGMKQASKSFHYEDGDSSKLITRQQADSLFAAEKIAKDY